jgi:putative lipase involved disintegration of autophagic bodies
MSVSRLRVLQNIALSTVLAQDLLSFCSGVLASLIPFSYFTPALSFRTPGQFFAVVSVSLPLRTVSLAYTD